MFRILTTTALALGLAFGSAAAAREFRVSSHEPAQGFYSANVLQVWIDKVNAALSPGNSFKLYPGAILGAPAAQGQLVKAGVADVALVVPSYMPGVFPMAGVVEVPGVVKTSTQGADLLNTLVEEGYLDKEFADYKLIAIFTTPSYSFFMNRAGARLPSDMNGVKIRTSSPYGITLLAKFGAIGVSAPAPQVYEVLERGVAEGCIWVLDAYRTFRLYEVAPTVISPHFTASPMLILMNKASYASLSEADRAAVDAMSGRAASEWIAGIVDATEAEVREEMRAKEGITVVDLTPEEQAQWDAALAGAGADWIAQSADKEAAARVLARAQELAGQ